MMKVEWSKYALSDISNIRDYIADDSYKNALDVMKRIREKAILLEDFPLIGVKSDIDGVYRLVVAKTSCSILYSVDEKALSVLRVIHQKQRWPLSVDDEKTILELLQ